MQSGIALTHRFEGVALLWGFLITISLHSLAGISVVAMAEEYDVVIVNGRVMDPESNLDAIRTLGIRKGTVETITTTALPGRVTIDASGLVVAPGFIDLHSHGQDADNYAHKAMDGVTTALELEGGTADVDRWYAEREGKALIHYGASVGHVPVRMQVMHDPGTVLPTGEAATRAASEAEIETFKQQIEQGLQRGALAVGFGLAYTPAASRWEVLEMFRVAARFGASCHVHLRYAGGKEPTNSLEALEEILAAAAITGAPLHVVHISSMGLRDTPHLLQMIGEAQKRGLDVTTECYPYTAAATQLESSMFDDGWQAQLGINYPDLQWVATGERLTAESFARYRAVGGQVLAYMIPEEILDAALTNPLTMIASDGILQHGKGHPRSSGTYARVLGRYVRETQALTLMDALRKMTLAPAQRLERRAPMMKNKGRIRVGADADLTAFDPALVIDRATYEEPAKYSEGIKDVLVNGVLVVKEGQLQQGIAPGQPVRAPIR